MDYSIAGETGIYFVSGKPGGGKSMLAVHLIVAELVKTQRMIVTNVPLRLDRLQEYMHDNNHDVHVASRVRLLTREETFQFFLFRSHTCTIEKPPQIKDKKGELIDDQSVLLDFAPSAADPGAKAGVAYYIDEIHLILNSQEWDKVGKWCFQYASQHRHLGDTVVCITQSVDNVVVQFRRLTQAFLYVKNNRVSKFGRFTVGNDFVLRVYEQAVTKDNFQNAQHFHKESIKFDMKGICSCYNTVGGIGMPGQATAAIGQKKKGLPLWSMWVGLAAVLVAGLVLVWQVPKWLSKAGSSAFASKVLPNPVTGQLKSKMPATGIVGASVGQPEAVTPVQRKYTVAEVLMDPLLATTVYPSMHDAKVWLAGMVRKGREVFGYTSDGRIILPTQIAVVGKDYLLTTSGALLHFRQASRDVQPSPPPRSGEAGQPGAGSVGAVTP